MKFSTFSEVIMITTIIMLFNCCHSQFVTVNTSSQRFIDHDGRELFFHGMSLLHYLLLLFFTLLFVLLYSYPSPFLFPFCYPNCLIIIHNFSDLSSFM